MKAFDLILEIVAVVAAALCIVQALWLDRDHEERHLLRAAVLLILANFVLR